ncbi:hypothetical protein RCL_jg17481.t1 [Rhizophagus clarus]|uniref:Uncharacterized protein n=1 Tax=Rhizophagus clarus TaxID=94130 RepID=A0A8H3KUJ7_9GLOM|nr:hypothetical protein RCL_jg17481.t1 [Rhizophagus clarus]
MMTNTSFRMDLKKRCGQVIQKLRHRNTYYGLSILVYNRIRKKEKIIVVKETDIFKKQILLNKITQLSLYVKILMIKLKK